MEKILAIYEEEGFRLAGGGHHSYDGFIIVTEKQQIKVGISNFQSCCESWGYFITNDDFSEFVGADLIDVQIVDTCLIKEKAPSLYDGGIMFVDFVTDRGTLQFTAYNSHNGYYGHQAVVESKQLSTEEVL